MNNFQRLEYVAGFLLLFSPATKAGAWTENQYLNSPNIIELMIQDEEHLTPPSPVTGNYLAGLVVHQEVQANWVQSEIGLQLFYDGERLDPRRYQLEWKVVVSPYSVAKARFIESGSMDFGQKIQIETPLNSLNGRLIGAIEIEVRISDRERPEKAPDVIVQTLREVLANGRDGL